MIYADMRSWSEKYPLVIGYLTRRGYEKISLRVYQALNKYIYSTSNLNFVAWAQNDI